VKTKTRIALALAAVPACACLLLAAFAWASETLTVEASFHPDKLGSPTNLSAKAVFHSTATGAPAPVSQVVVYLPAGLRIDVQGAGTCVAAQLEAAGPRACPANSRIGFGGGTGVLELAHELIHEPYTLDLFLGPSEAGQLTVLAYVDASSPASFQIVVVAKEIQAPPPYGLGFTVNVPPILTLPEASNASIESAFLTVGDDNVAYYRTVHAHRTLLHVKGIVVPKACPASGFPYKALISFEDGTSLTDTGVIACPRK
jgi:hypothetical protein